MGVVRGGICFVVIAVGMLIAPAVASAALTLDVVAPNDAPRGDPVQITMTVGNTGPGAQEFDFGTLELRAGGEKSVNNPYESITTSSGTCAPDPVDSYGYHGATCQLNLAPAQSAQIDAVVRLNESMDHLAGVLDASGAFSSNGPFDSTTVQAIYPPRVSGSNKIKIKGLPDSCVDDDFQVTVSSKGAKKVTASLAGPYDEWHGRLLGDGFSQKIGAEKGKKLKVEVPLERERAGFYDLKLAAKFEGKPKQKAEVSIQRCGIPDG